MKRLVWILPFVCMSAYGQNNSLNLQLPSGPTSYQSDKFRAGDLDCSNAIGGGTNLEFGVTGIINNAEDPFSGYDPISQQRKDIGVYARIVIPLDGPEERINCNTLYKLELEKKQLEVLKLRREVENLRRIAQNDEGFEN
tara:strand:- start:445 stop:864 length:420 start_codon:yes stop_codon:yes gene_type:complete